MAIDRKELRALYQEIERQYQEENKENIAKRVQEGKEHPDVFLTQAKLNTNKKKLKPVTLNIRNLGVHPQDLAMAYASMGINLELADKPSSPQKSALSKNKLILSPQDLIKINKHIQKRQKQYGANVKDRNNYKDGIPYSQLLRNSDKGDKERAKLVKNCTPYGRKGDIYLFQVTGNQKPHYKVEIQLHDFSRVSMDTSLNTIQAAKEIINGRISIECPCSRHQFWYRYLATIGNYAVKPANEKDFPKIRNPLLKGCCCKHVLKALNTIQKNQFILILARAIDKARSATGYGNDITRARQTILSGAELAIAQQTRLAGKFAQEFKTREGALREKLTPRGGKRQKTEGETQAKPTTAPKPTSKTKNKPTPKPKFTPKPTSKPAPTPTPTKPQAQPTPRVQIKLTPTLIKRMISTANISGMDPAAMLSQAAKTRGWDMRDIEAIMRENGINYDYIEEE